MINILVYKTILTQAPLMPHVPACSSFHPFGSSLPFSLTMDLTTSSASLVLPTASSHLGLSGTSQIRNTARRLGREVAVSRWRQLRSKKLYSRNFSGFDRVFHAILIYPSSFISCDVSFTCAGNKP